MKTAPRQPTAVPRPIARPHRPTDAAPAIEHPPTETPTSRLPGFHHLALDARRERLTRTTGVQAGRATLPLRTADQLSENVIGTFALPLGVGLNLRVNGVDRLVPMSVEEPSIVAAFSRAARMTRSGVGIRAQADPPITVVQIHLADVARPRAAMRAIRAAEGALREQAHAAVPRLVRRGGGVRRLTVRPIVHRGSGQRFLTVQLHVDVREAMGANLVNTIGESVAPELARLTGGRVVMTILSNLADERLARARCDIPAALLGFGGREGRAVGPRLEEAWRIADADPYRAVTHNKGVMNGIDAAAAPLGQDVRAIEAGAHAFAARSGRVRPLSRWRWHERQGVLRATIEIPLAVTAVGPLKRVHPGVAEAHALLGEPRAQEIAGILAAVGLCQSLAACQVLVTEGIQRGHMRLHGRRTAP